jgi:glycosyltransferase involved in cell wall biosynthesis
MERLPDRHRKITGRSPGVTPAAIDNALYNAYGQRLISTIYTQSSQYRVVLEAQPEFQQGPASLEGIYVPSSTGQQVRLSAVARISERTTPLVINHLGQFPSSTISFNLASGFALGDAVKAIGVAAKEIGMPVSVQTRFQGAALAATFDVLHPIVRPDRYRASGPRSRVLHVGLNQRKGAAITVAIARLRPDIPFTMVRTWEGLRPPPEDAAIIEMAHALPNIEIIPAQRDPKRLYGMARLMLVPSAWDETWGRVVTEAQLNGIPVVASDRGGLPESVGSGGMLLHFEDDPSLWAEAVGRLWDDPVCHADYAARALCRAQQSDVAFAPLRARFFEILEAARRLRG